MNQILAVLRRPHPGYANFKVYFGIGTAIALGVFLILSILQPFNIGDRNILGNPFLTAFVYAGGSFVTILINFFWIKLFPRSFSDEKWTLGKEMLAFSYQMISIALTIWLINYFRGTSSPNIHGYFGMLWKVFSIGFFPYLIILLMRHLYLMKNKLQKASKMNIGLMLKNKEAQHKDTPQYVNLQNSTKSVDINTFISAESKDDYVEINFSHNGKIEKLILNATLKEFEAENSHFDQLFQCHDKFIINRNKIIWVEGNAAGFKLLLHPELPHVTVSREKTEELKKRMDVAKFA